MTASIITQARMGRIVALNTLAARKAGAEPKVVQMEAAPTVMFKSVKGAAAMAAAPSTLMSGYVVWYNEARGVGAFACRETGAMVTLEAETLRAFGLHGAPELAFVEARCVETSRGPRAVELLELREHKTAMVG